MSTFFPKGGIRGDKKWILIDASGVVVGRLAAYVASVLRGKGKVDYAPYRDCGDNVVIINASKVAFSGKKMRDKIYYKHTGYPGGLKSFSPYEISQKHPSYVIEMAVKRMLSTGPLARMRLKNLYIYPGADHPHAGQTPIPVDFLAMNGKNKA